MAENQPTDNFVAPELPPTSTPVELRVSPPLQRRVARTGERGRGFSAQEVDDFLATLEEVIPVGGEEWSRVVECHNAKWRCMKRKEDGLRRKFAKLHNTTVPTGDGYCPSPVRRAKTIRQEILRKADMGSTGIYQLTLSDNEEQHSGARDLSPRPNSGNIRDNIADQVMPLTGSSLSTLQPRSVITKRNF